MVVGQLFIAVVVFLFIQAVLPAELNGSEWIFCIVLCCHW